MNFDVDREELEKNWKLRNSFKITNTIIAHWKADKLNF